jgi:hypothetical protein
MSVGDRNIIDCVVSIDLASAAGRRITGALASGRSSSELLASVDALYFFVILSVLGSWHLLKVARHARSRDLTLSAYLSLPANQKLAADFEMEAGIHYATTGIGDTPLFRRTLPTTNGDTSARKTGPGRSPPLDVFRLV